MHEPLNPTGVHPTQKERRRVQGTDVVRGQDDDFTATQFQCILFDTMARHVPIGSARDVLGRDVVRHL
eukprot:5818434-Prymnesium_polylepis.3